jgi:hypothetical protein
MRPNLKIVLCMCTLSAAAIAAAPGTTCVPTGTANNAYRIWGGIGSSTVSAGTSSTFACDQTLSSWQDLVIDASNQSDANGEVSCKLARYSTDGSATWTDTRWLCSEAGGCLSRAVPGNVNNYIKWTTPFPTGLGGMAITIECSVTNNGGKSKILGFHT